MTALVSVVIPCRNGGAWLGEAIESCLQQTWRELEVIVVDNGSTDDSLAVARRQESERVVVLQCAREGASAARNFGIAKARGDFVQFLDADDVLHRDKITVQMQRLASSPPDSVASGGWAPFRHGPAEARFAPEPVWRDLSPEDFLISSWLGGGMMPPFVWLTPRPTIERAGPWNETLSVQDDGEYFCRVLLASSGVRFCEQARGYYRRPAAPTLSRRRDRAALASCFAATALSCDHLLVRLSTPAAKHACATHYQRFVFDAYPDVPELTAEAERRAAELGGSTLQAPGGRAFRLLSGWLGWKLARRCQVATRQVRRRHLGSGAQFS